MNEQPSLFAIALYFGVLSLLAIGGANAVIPDMHRHLVGIQGWMSSGEFVALTALSQAAPGPNVLIVTLLGWKLAGLPGALIATTAMILPSSLLAYFFSGFWQRVRTAHWHALVQAGLGPVTIGLILASGYVVTRAADHNVAAFVVSGATAALVLVTKVHPLWLLAGAALLGVFGVV